MRRTPREDIEFVEGFIKKDRENRVVGVGGRYFHKGSMSQELHNILLSIGVGENDNNTHPSFVADDETYLKALDILKIIIEEGEMEHDIYLLRQFQEDVWANGYYGAWYIINETYLSDTTKNIIKSYGRDRLGTDDFENIIKMAEVLL